MNPYGRLLVKVLLITAAFVLLLGVAVIATTAIFQSHIHPDEWTTTPHDIAAMALVAVTYIAVIARIFYNFAKGRIPDVCKEM